MLTLCYAPSYGIEICEARRLTTEEKRHYAAWFAETGFIGVGSQMDLGRVELFISETRMALSLK